MTTRQPSDVEWNARPISTGSDANSRYYAPLDCEGREKCKSIRCALHPLSMHAVWKSEEKKGESQEKRGESKEERGESEEKKEKMRSWTAPGKAELKLFSGSGQLDEPFATSHGEFASLCEETEFSPEFLRNLRGKQPLYNCRIHRDHDNNPTVLELAMAVYETDAVFILVRYDIAAQFLKGLVFFKKYDAISKCPVELSTALSFLEERRDEIAADPLAALPALLSLLQFRAHTPVRWRVSLLNAEAWLGVTRRRAFLNAKGYPPATDDFAFLNAHLASLSHELDDTIASADSIQLLHEQLAIIVRICEGAERCPSPAEQTANCKAIQARLYVLQASMSRENMATLKGALWNRMGAAETQTTKSIAFIGLLFLPTMLVASVMAAGIFNFQGTVGGASGGPVVSRDWPIFVALCVVLTIITIGVWFAWERWGTQWLMRLGIAEIQNRWQNERHYLPVELDLRKKQIEESSEQMAKSTRPHCLDGYYCMQHNSGL